MAKGQDETGEDRCRHERAEQQTKSRIRLFARERLAQQQHLLFFARVAELALALFVGGDGGFIPTHARCLCGREVHSDARLFVARHRLRRRRGHAVGCGVGRVSFEVEVDGGHKTPPVCSVLARGRSKTSCRRAHAQAASSRRATAVAVVRSSKSESRSIAWAKTRMTSQ